MQLPPSWLPLTYLSREVSRLKNGMALCYMYIGEYPRKKRNLLLVEQT